MTSPRTLLTALRRDALRDALLATVDLLRRRRAADVPERDIDDYVALDWLEWHGGTLRLTTVGDNVCKQLFARLT
ncbi:hypothetical protein M8A51_11470 [Schlegelella sp. S2-27]|uniref:Uncharacterized protein n=1 Tax=Caldimonas mangrovi TaxID=2944811 RepID=A0ABT0YN43_9BURK|nr:hypothetical protein [Caldimonas mangrovi]MCM5680153.1 hypothetical protein [Caldimonas mangrovi]